MQVKSGVIFQPFQEKGAEPCAKVTVSSEC